MKKLCETKLSLTTHVYPLFPPMHFLKSLAELRTEDATMVEAPNLPWTKVRFTMSLRESMISGADDLLGSDMPQKKKADVPFCLSGKKKRYWSNSKICLVHLVTLQMIMVYGSYKKPRLVWMGGTLKKWLLQREAKGDTDGFQQLSSKKHKLTLVANCCQAAPVPSKSRLLLFHSRPRIDLQSTSPCEEWALLLWSFQHPGKLLAFLWWNSKLYPSGTRIPNGKTTCRKTGRHLPNQDKQIYETLISNYKPHMTIDGLDLMSRNHCFSKTITKTKGKKKHLKSLRSSIQKQYVIPTPPHPSSRPLVRFETCQRQLE